MNYRSFKPIEIAIISRKEKIFESRKENIRGDVPIWVITHIYIYI
jgi:hypothetical protein